MARLAPSILSADFAHLAQEVTKVEPASDLLHVDVMDGHFVPNLSLGPPVIKSLRKTTDLYFDCHLMMDNPGEYLEVFKEVGASGCSVHLEAGRTAELLAQMRRLDLDVGLAINPDTPFEAFEEYLDKIDLLLLMTVFPGFGGQRFIEDVMPKVSRTREVIEERNLAVSIEVDGGIDHQTAPIAAQNGADTFVAGSAVFAQQDPLEAAWQIKAAIEVVEAARS
jgi:ribulose-phosphate 3-epimerase